MCQVLIRIGHRFVFSSVFVLMGSTACLAQQFIPVYEAASDPVHRSIAAGLRQEMVLEQLTNTFNQIIQLPSDVMLSMGECGTPNAYYDPDTRKITMCYELLVYYAELFSRVEADQKAIETAIGGAFVFTLFHELGHALVDVLDLPITGREEDAVDQLSTTLLLAGDETEGPGMVLQAAHWFILQAEIDREAGLDINDLPFYDEHAMNPTRFYNLICWVYGSNPDAYWDLATQWLPESRADRCSDEYRRFVEAWDRLLAEPWRE